ncbi:MAG: sigma-70 family RNA polymerase sigma factor [Clostridiales bacterium]|nr:sigma-70 family RNA polymerase sigma factor [Clostridiales bacterium]
MSEVHLSSLMEEYARSRDTASMHAIVEAYLPFSRTIARKFSGQGVETEDLEQVAAMALMKAVERFEPERGLKFTTFATPTIAGEVRNYLRDKGSTIRMGRDVRTKVYQLRKIQEKLTWELQREPSMKELAQAMDMTYDELLSLLDARQQSETVSLSSPLGSDQDAQELEERLGGLEEGFERVEQRDWMAWIFSQVTPQEKQLLELRYVHRMGQREIAREMGISQMQVSRLERRILARLRETAEPWQPLH